MPDGGMVRCHEQRVLRGDARADGLPDHPVDVPRVGDVVRVAIVRAERHAPRPVLLDEREEREEVARHRGLADEQPHPGAQPLATLLDGERLVIGADAGGCVRLQMRAEHTRRVAVDVARALEHELLELGGRSVDDAGEVHHLRQSEHPSPAHERLEIPRRQRSAWRLERRRRDARRRHEEDVELQARGRVEQPVHAVDAENVRDLVRIGDDRRRPQWKHESSELVDHELRRLEVEVRVDESRNDEASGCGQRLGPPVARRRPR